MRSILKLYLACIPLLWIPAQIECDILGDPGGKIAEGLKYVGQCLVKASENVDPAKIQEMSVAAQKTAREVTKNVTDALSNAFKNLTLHHTFDHRPAILLSQGACAIVTFGASAALVYKSLTGSDSVQKTKLQAIVGSVGMTTAIAWLVYLGHVNLYPEAPIHMTAAAPELAIAPTTTVPDISILDVVS